MLYNFSTEEFSKVVGYLVFSDRSSSVIAEIKWHFLSQNDVWSLNLMLLQYVYVYFTTEMLVSFYNVICYKFPRMNNVKENERSGYVSTVNLQIEKYASQHEPHGKDSHSVRTSLCLYDKHWRFLQFREYSLKLSRHSWFCSTFLVEDTSSR